MGNPNHFDELDVRLSLVTIHEVYATLTNEDYDLKEQRVPEADEGY